MIDDSSCLKLVMRAKALREGGQSEFTDFDDANVTAAAQCVRHLNETYERDLGNPYVVVTDPYYASKLEAVRSQMLHDKRCLASYLKARLDVVTEGWWQQQNRAALRDKMTAAELQFDKDVSSLMVQYMNALGGFDIRAGVRGPPSLQRYVLVRGVKDFSFVSPMTGKSVTIYPGKCMSLPHEDIETLLANNVIELM
eukprot:PhM_4_TR16155/c1_g2_i2/m.77077/K10732/GINS1, PSF1; GINS complex subunit 1